MPPRGHPHAAVSPDSRYLAVGGPGCFVWNLANPEAYPHQIGNSGAWEGRFTSDSHILAAAGDLKRWWRYDFSTGLASDFEFRNGGAGHVYVAGYALHPRGQVLKVRWVHDLGGSQFRDEWASYRLTASGFEWAATTEPLTQGGFDPRSFSPAGDCYACKYYGGGYDLRDAVTDEVVQAFAVPDHPKDYFDSVTFTPDGRRMFVINRDHVVGFDREAGILPAATVVASSRPGGRGFVGLACSPRGQILATAEDTGEVVPPDGPPIHRVKRALRARQFRKRTRCFVTLRDVATLRPLRTYDFGFPSITCVTFTPDGTRCVLGNTHGQVLLFDVE